MWQSRACIVVEKREERIIKRASRRERAARGWESTLHMLGLYCEERKRWMKVWKHTAPYHLLCIDTRLFVTLLLPLLTPCHALWGAAPVHQSGSLVRISDHESSSFYFMHYTRLQCVDCKVFFLDSGSAILCIHGYKTAPCALYMFNMVPSLTVAVRSFWLLWRLLEQRFS